MVITFYFTSKPVKLSPFLRHPADDVLPAIFPLLDNLIPHLATSLFPSKVQLPSGEPLSNGQPSPFPVETAHPFSTFPFLFLQNYYPPPSPPAAVFFAKKECPPPVFVRLWDHAPALPPTSFLCGSSSIGNTCFLLPAAQDGFLPPSPNSRSPSSAKTSGLDFFFLGGDLSLDFFTFCFFLLSWTFLCFLSLEIVPTSPIPFSAFSYRFRLFSQEERKDPPPPIRSYENTVLQLKSQRIML